MCEESVGDAGASSLGYYGGHWAPDGAGVLAHGFTGALHLWRRAGTPLSHDARCCGLVPRKTVHLREYHAAARGAGVLVHGLAGALHL